MKDFFRNRLEILGPVPADPKPQISGDFIPKFYRQASISGSQ
jgi:hypothetical protein